jgi:hypothetical protein
VWLPSTGRADDRLIRGLLRPGGSLIVFPATCQGVVNGVVHILLPISQEHMTGGEGDTGEI